MEQVIFVIVDLKISRFFAALTVIQFNTSANANTCPLELEVLGNVETYEDFKKNMDCAINAQEEGFGII